MSPFQTLSRCVCAAVMAVALSACERSEPTWSWQYVALPDAGVELLFPCHPQFAQTRVDFGMDVGSVPVHMMGCDAVDSTFALSHWLLDDVTQADDALAFWQVAVLAQFEAVDGSDSKSGAAFVPAGAMDLPRSIQASVEGEGRAGWMVTTHGAWFARQEGEQVRLFHAVIYAPQQYHRTAQTFFQSIALK